MELRHLEHFIAVAETGSFTRAATVVHVGQSALSASVRALERQLGTRLFDRTTHSVDLTEAGTALIAEARHTLRAAEAARDAVAAVSGGTRGTLRIGIMHSMTAIDLAGLLSRFRIERPLVRIEPHTHPSGSAGLIDAVAEHRLDVAIAALPTPPRADITVTVHPCPVFTISLVTATDRPLSAAVQAFVDLAHRSLGRSDDATRS
jgi:DNA-binding transcriptional LysR family regulator